MEQVINFLKLVVERRIIATVLTALVTLSGVMGVDLGFDVNEAVALSNELITNSILALSSFLVFWSWLKPKAKAWTLKK